MNNFKELRKQKKLTLRQVEDKTGISNAYLSQLETGKIKNPSHKVVEKLNKLYGQSKVEIPIEFIDWLGDNFIKLHGGWIPKYANQIKANPIPTNEMFNLYKTARV